jgi:hypothetical protein
MPFNLKETDHKRLDVLLESILKAHAAGEVTRNRRAR